MGWLSRIFGKDPGSARAEALRAGLSVREVDREVPFFDPRGEWVETRKGRCVRYAWPRCADSVPPEWEFLQRTRSEGAQYPNGWLFRSGDVVAPMPLHDALTRVAERYDEEYFEFEATPTEIVVYWDEWGGAEQVAVLLLTLRELAEL